MRELRLISNDEIVISQDEYHQLVQSHVILEALKETKPVLTILELTEEYNDVLLDGEEPISIIETSLIIEEKVDITIHG